jgi:ferredoxin-NADP reductase
MQNSTVIWSIVEKRSEAPGVFSLVLEAQGERPPFIAGQYVTVRLPHFEPIEGKSYSIASTPSEKHITLTIKEMGGFSHAILTHGVGDTITTSLPYGFFYPEPDESSGLAFVVGGIGITPCMSIIGDLLEHDYQKPITLFYSNKTQADIVFKNTLNTLAQKHPNFKIHHFITREPNSRPDLEFIQGPALNEQPVTYGRITADFIVTNTQDPHETDFFICGSIDFTKDMWKSLKTDGINLTRLFTEGFF